jgi:hypothetical protein
MSLTGSEPGNPAQGVRLVLAELIFNSRRP